MYLLASIWNLTSYGGLRGLLPGAMVSNQKDKAGSQVRYILLHL